MNRLILICISFTFCSLLYGQKDIVSWRLCGQTTDNNVKAYFVSGKNISCRNVLTFKNGQVWDTLDLCSYASMLPYFKDTCLVQSIQMDGQGNNEVVLSWDYELIRKNEIQRYKIYNIWDLDTRERFFYMTPNYYRWNEEIIYMINESGKILDSTITLDSCVYQCNFEINPIGHIIISNLTQKGSCPDSGCWKRTEGIYFYEDKKLQWKKNNDG